MVSRKIGLSRKIGATDDSLINLTSSARTVETTML